MQSVEGYHMNLCKESWNRTPKATSHESLSKGPVISRALASVVIASGDLPMGGSAWFWVIRIIYTYFWSTDLVSLVALCKMAVKSWIRKLEDVKKSL